MQLPAPIQVRLQWRSGIGLEAPLRERVARELAGLSWELSQMEALLHDAMRVSGHERAYLMPRLELRLPLYDAGRRLRVVFSHIDAPRIHIADEEGKRMADVTLV
ncbi:MAG TPA: hypothetical protein VM370_04900 [Candidatus Thermoplasmatota archaeon]|nr:hypothetical protein [Candidatus Thermoplasmatota archaeon]